MDDLIRGIVRNNTPVMNPDIVNGLATKLIPGGLEYIDRVLRSASRSFPDGFEYVESVRCTPQEEFRELTKPKSGARRSFDVAQSDLYLVKYKFRYDGKDLPVRHIYHPFMKDGGIITLSGSDYMCSPVLSDRVISPGEDNVFLQILRDKVKFERTKHTVRVDGVRRSVTVVYSTIYKRSKDAKKISQTTKAESTPIHYLIARYGFDTAMVRLLGFVPEVGMNFSTVTHNKDDYVIISASGIKPKTNLEYVYRPSEIMMAIPKEKYNNDILNIIGSVYYVIDHFPGKIKIEYLNSKELFSVLLGEIIFSGEYQEVVLLQYMREHFSSLEECIDHEVKSDLESLGYHDVNDFFDMMILILLNFNKYILSGMEELNSMYGKVLSVLYNVYYPITHAIFNMVFLLSKASSKKRLTEREITEVMNKSLTMGKIFDLTDQHISMSSVSYSGDNKFYKITSVIVPKSARNTQLKKGSKAVASDQVKTLHYSFAEAGGYLNLSKPDPSGFARVNPYVHLDEKSTIIRNPDLVELLDSVAYKLKNKVCDDKHNPNLTRFERRKGNAV